MNYELIKVCGMREPENIQQVTELGIDLMGFIFWPKSPRYVKSVTVKAGIVPKQQGDKKCQEGKACGSVC